MATKKTYNVPDCTCGEDHDSLEHIAYALLSSPYAAVLGPRGLAQEFERAAHEVGWRNIDLDSLDFSEDELRKVLDEVPEGERPEGENE